VTASALTRPGERDRLPVKIGQIEWRLAGLLAIVAGAGAMMLGSQTFHFPDGLDETGLPRRVAVREALGLLPGIFVAPHFDAVPGELWRRWAEVWPAGHRMLGIDEDTAIVESTVGWTVAGKGRALVFRSLDDHDVHASGARFEGIRVADASRT